MVGKVGFDIGGRAAASGNDVTRVQKRMKNLMILYVIYEGWPLLFFR